ncbi:DUF6735 family protein [Salinibaculum rarum]|uniref:DUF6735 family protein n=1 Tax=Salinibaculum rarum TaxID=3058903 RepID=UPI00265E6BB0|nr:DUF6735 family protein [Salinibaculum sp. KK48]
MGYRALVLYETDPRKAPSITGPSIDTPTRDAPDEYRVALHSQNGALGLRLIDDITTGSRFGQKNPPEAVIGGSVTSYIDDETEVDATYAFTDGEPRDVNPNAVIAEHLTVEDAIHEHLSFGHYEALYLVHSNFTVDAYRVLSTRFPAGLLPNTDTTSTVGEGVLYSPREPSEEAYTALEGWYDGLRQATAARVRNNEFTQDEGCEYLRRALIGRLDAATGVTIPRFSPYHMDNVAPRYVFAPDEGLEDVQLWEATMEDRNIDDEESNDRDQRTMKDFK